MSLRMTSERECVRSEQTPDRSLFQNQVTERRLLKGLNSALTGQVPGRRPLIIAGAITRRSVRSNQM